MDEVDAVVIGAGVVGLAVARALVMRGEQTVLLERAEAVGTGCSSRNSEVIHAGLYYPSGSLKARLCVQGRELLYAFCESRGVAHRRCGKLLVACDDAQCASLDRWQSQARRNGVTDLQWLDAAQTRVLEPQLNAVAALWSPSTGIIDSHALMLALWADFERHGGVLALRSPLERAEFEAPRHVLHVGGPQPTRLAARRVVNAAGLWAPAVAARADGLPAQTIPRSRYAKGNYFSLSGRAPFTHLIYPMPDDAGLGVHLTLDLAGRARFGPDVEWISPDSADQIDYRVDPSRLAQFEAAIRRYWPGLPGQSLAPDYSGVRPKVAWNASVAQDFCVQGPAEHGLAGWINLFGIESPGLTASLALAQEVLTRL